ARLLSLIGAAIDHTTRAPADPTLAKPPTPTPSGALVGAQNVSAGSSRKDASEQGLAPAQPQKDGGLDDPLVAFSLLEALRANDLPALDKLLDCLPPSPASPGFGLNLSPLTKTPVAPQSWAGPAAPALVPVHLSPLHLAIQVSSAETVAHILARKEGDVNAQNSKGDTPLHLAARAGRVGIVDALLADPRVNDAVRNAEGKLPDEVAKMPQIAAKIRGRFRDRPRRAELYFNPAAGSTDRAERFAHSGDFASLKNLFADPRTAALADINHQDPIGGATVLHAAVQRENGGLDIVRWLLDRGADVFIRDRRGKLPFELAKNEKVRTMLKQWNGPICDDHNHRSGKAAENAGFVAEMDQLCRWLQNSMVCFGERKQEDTDNACRGSVSLRIAKLSLDPSDPQKFELVGRGSVRYHLRAEHSVEAKRWIFAITQTKQWLDESADR
ncbi:MAG: ankyrin repeat-containing domain protein, partial [Olpidium bornovanus]